MYKDTFRNKFLRLEMKTGTFVLCYTRPETTKNSKPHWHLKAWRNQKCYPSEPGLEGELSEEMEVTEATDRGLWEEGMVKERTMDEGRGPRRSSAGG